MSSQELRKVVEDLASFAADAYLGKDIHIHKDKIVANLQMLNNTIDEGEDLLSEDVKVYLTSVAYSYYRMIERAKIQLF